MMSDVNNTSAQTESLIRPIAASALAGFAFVGDSVVALDRYSGSLISIEPATGATTVLNPYPQQRLSGARGLAYSGGLVWISQERTVYQSSLTKKGRLGPLEPLLSLPEPVEGVAVDGDRIYLTCRYSSRILIFDRALGKQVGEFYAPGVGEENLYVHNHSLYGPALWVCDSLEQTVYCLDLQTGDLRFNLLTPFEQPSGLAFLGDELYVAYAGDERYIRESPNDEDPFQVAVRDQTFIHSLSFKHFVEERYTLSGGYRVELTYLEEIDPLEPVTLEDLTWKIALPDNTHRQKVCQVEPVGMPFTEEVHGTQRMAVFHFDRLEPGEVRLFGWRAVLEVRGIKYNLRFEDVEDAGELPAELREQYLVDDDDLAMDTESVRQAAVEAIGSETNLLRQMLGIRNYVYDHLSYRVTPYIDAPDSVLERGSGSCGEYVGVLLALARLNGIACRTVGRYKCPPHPDLRGVPLIPEYNHVWIEFYIPDFGWVPMESNPDDTGDSPYPRRFFMGLPWLHVEIGRGISFETISARDYSIGELAINHVRFRVLDEL
ncbi:transglutaminase domain-containing protein [Leptolyngbya sp. FACHB-261]|uniref:transglutaminase domain-containing protein n=1 Tax=Leptolyngbya sp. FACHB-261 TaxID=2692806 RepID=UPI001681F11A|nr:transglutaminase domain-containing protein [Leptolyngbya sp. FACHB-261]MBD2099666.1 transglutaminase [Leptolyngbya sp. FACHB-261]